MCSIIMMIIIIHVCLLLLINILDIYDIAHVPHHLDVYCRCLLQHAHALFAVILIVRSGIRLGWLIYLVVHPNEVMSDRLVNTCSAGNNNCKCSIDTPWPFWHGLVHQKFCLKFSYKL